MKRPFESDSSQLWTSKYRPVTVKGILGNTKAVTQIKQWLAPQSALRTKHSFILLNGPPGTGKSLAATLVAESLGYRIISCSVTLASIPDGLLTESCNDKTRKQYLKSMSDESAQLYSILVSLQNRNPLFKQSLPPVLILDDFDGITMKIKSLLDCVKKLSCPTILICNDRYDSKLKSIGSQVLHVPFYSVPTLQIEQLLKTVATAERIPVTGFLTEIARQSKGDVRYALMSLQFMNVAGIKSPKTEAKPSPALSLKDALKQFHQPATSFKAPEMNIVKAQEGSGFSDVSRLFDPNNTLQDLFTISQGSDGLDHGDVIFTWRIHDTYPQVDQVSLDAVAKSADSMSLADLDYPGSLLSHVESNIKVPWLTAGTLNKPVPPFPPLVQTLNSIKKTHSDWDEVLTHLKFPTRSKIKSGRVILAGSTQEFLVEDGATVLSHHSKKVLSTDDRKIVTHYNKWGKDLAPQYYPTFPTEPGDFL